MTTWQEAVTHWKQGMRSDYTRHSFGVAVELFFAWSGEDLDTLSYDTLDSWVFALADRTNAVPKLGKHLTWGTVNKYLLALKLFLKFCVKKELLTSLTLEQLEEVLKKWPSIETKRYEILSEQEMQNLMNIAPSTRERCMIALGLYAGLRNFEICNLLVGHIGKDDQGAYVHVEKGKGNKSADVSIDDNLYALLKVYAGDKGPKERMWNIGTYHLREIVADCVQAAGINKRITVHSLRHTYAFRLAKSGVPVLAISKMLRHGNLAVTTTYLDHLTREETARYAPVFPG